MAQSLGLAPPRVATVIELLDAGNTVPFITRYRKDQTGGLDEEQIRQIQSRVAKLRLLQERKQTILRSIESQGKLTPQLAAEIEAAATNKRLEDLYLPFKPRKQTLATLARTRGLEPLAQEILAADPACADLDARAADFVNTDRQVATAADALLGAGHILAEMFSEQLELREKLRGIIEHTGQLVSTAVEPETKPENKAERGGGQPAAGDSGGASPAPGDTTETQKHRESSHQRQAMFPSMTDGEEAGSGAAAASATYQASEAAAPEASSAELSLPETSVAEASTSAAAATETEPSPAAPEMSDTKAPAAEDEAAIAAAPDSESEPATVESNPGESATGELATGPSAPAVAHETAAPVRAAPNRQQAKKNAKAKQKEQDKEREQRAFRDYFRYNEALAKVPPHRVLAINRGERAKVLRVKVEADQEAMFRLVDELLV
ncbi:MAG TPA: Tex-like N-terminal domain-containing protein, partial [Pirellulales bacterium]|nr:Tex-like N-terminal domain-containing protein [Pirellulales bacterium]